MRRSLRPVVAAVAAMLLLPLLAVPADARASGPIVAPAQVDGPDVADRPLLRLGDTGSSVAAWQRQLRVVTGADLAVDGLYGTPTEEATAGFQRFFGLRVDGIVGEDTRELMRYLLAVGHELDEIARDLRGEGIRVVGYQGDVGYCLEVQDGDEVGVSCGEASAAPIGAQLVDVGDRQVLLGTVEGVIDEVEVELADGTTRNVPVVDPSAFGRDVWVVAEPPSQVDVVRALAGDGSEVRAVVVDDATAYLVLERGDRGPRVQQWQRRLNRVTGAGLATDGIFGTNTVTATRSFQRFFGLRVDGIVGPRTRETMEYVLALQGGGPTEPPDEQDPEGALGEPTAGASATDDFPATSADGALLTDVRVGAQQGFDRVVFEFREQLPSWQVEPVAPPIYEQPSGIRRAVAGDAHLRITMAPASGVDLAGAQPEETYTGPERIALEGSAVVEVVQTSDFENRLAWVLGLTGDAEYGVAELSSPPRLVVDVRD
jgi:peptidoglycan hydrolase-like protein with peptidoglycan-binding domain